MICRQCNTKLPEGARYCHICGTLSIGLIKSRHHRAQGLGSITVISGRKHPYWVRMPASYNGNRVVRQSIGCYRTRAEAEAALARAIYYSGSTTSPNIYTVRDIYNRFVVSCRYTDLSSSGQQSHRSAWTHLSACADIPIDRLNSSVIQRVVDDMTNAGKKHETVAKVRNLASLLCREAMGLGLLTANYAQWVYLPKRDTISARPYTSAHLDLIWTQADAGDQTAMAVIVMCYTGMRPGEAMSLRLEQHLHIAGEYKYVITGSKTAAGLDRVIPLPPVIWPLIDALVGNRTSGALIATAAGKPYTLDHWRSHRFAPLMGRLSLHRYTPYSCRHTYVNMQKRRQVAPEIMMPIMGHTDYSTTVERYQTTTAEDIAIICNAVMDMTRPTTET